MLRWIVLAVLAAALPLRADRVRVVVAVDEPFVAAAAAGALRHNVIASLRGATNVEPWGPNGRAFAAEIDRAELEWLVRDPRVKAVSLDAGGGGALLESLRVVGGDLVRAGGLDGTGVTVAVLDTGIDLSHPDFAGRIAGQQCFCDNLDGTGCCPNGAKSQSGDGAAADDNGHGTHVSGIIAGSGASAPAGLAPAARIVAVKVMDQTNRFKGFTQVYRGLEWVAEQRLDVDVINMSLGSSALFSSADCGNSAIAFGMEEVIRDLRRRGVLITASSGNQSSTSGMAVPACMDDVLAVGATYDAPGTYGAFCAENGTTDQVTCFTNSTDSLDLVAPGAPISASRRGGGATVLSGTSMAAPHVAATIALMLQASGGLLTSDQTEQILKATGKPVTDTRNGLTFPRLDTAAAVSATPRPPTGPRRRAVGK